MLSNGELEQFRIVLQPELLHDPVLVKCDGARRQFQNVCRLFHRATFREQLQNFSLAAKSTIFARELQARE